MEINLNNYEAFFLDHKEGNLSAEQEKELFLFLESNPHLYEILSSYEPVLLENIFNEQAFENKSGLKKNDFSNENLIAYTEGLVDAVTKNEIETLSEQNNAFKKELTYYKNTVAKPDLNIKYKNKSKLKRGGVVIALQSNYTFLRVAAAILLLIGLFLLVSKLNTKEEAKNNTKEIASKDKQDVRDKKQEARSKNQEPSNKNQDARIEPQLTNNNSENKQPKKKYIGTMPVNDYPEKNNIVENAPLKDRAPLSLQNDSLTGKTVLANNTTVPENQNISKSYFNSSDDSDDEIVSKKVVASAEPRKKTFFQKLARAAKEVNDLGIKKVNASEEERSSTLMIGGIVLSESKSVQ